MDSISAEYGVDQAAIGPAGAEPVVSVRGLVRRYGSREAVAGTAAGIDMALALTGRVHGPAVAEAIQLVIEYDPQPPFDAGAPHKASDQARQAAGTMLAAASSP